MIRTGIRTCSVCGKKYTWQELLKQRLSDGNLIVQTFKPDVANVSIKGSCYTAICPYCKQYDSWNTSEG